MIEAAEIFHVETVEEAGAPAGMPDEPWCRYVVANRRSRVVGRFQGTIEQARRNAERLASNINERTATGRSELAPPPGVKRKPPRPGVKAARSAS
jgi:hypothetical protein